MTRRRWSKCCKASYALPCSFLFTQRLSRLKPLSILPRTLTIGMVDRSYRDSMVELWSHISSISRNGNHFRKVLRKRSVHDSFSASFQPIPFKVGDWTARTHFFSRLRYQQCFSATTVPKLDTRSHHQWLCWWLVMTTSVQVWHRCSRKILLVSRLRKQVCSSCPSGVSL